MTFTLDLPSTLVMSSNQRLHHMQRATMTRQIIQATLIASRGLPKLGKATLFIGVTKATKRAYDPGNLYPTAKACVDALVRSGRLDEDNYDHLQGPFLWHRGIDRHLAKKGINPERVRFTFTFLTYSTIPF